jgi:dehydrogenase/reductase SDR family protein 12
MHLPALLDRALDWAPPLSYGRVGVALRRGGFDPIPALTGQTCVVTGGTSGIGRATARLLGASGAEVIVVGRDRARGAAAAAEVDAAGGHGRFEPCDVSRLDDVAALVARLPARIDALVHGAGAMATTCRRTEQGVEETWATHVLGPFALTAQLLPKLRAAPSARVVFVSSGGMYLARLALDAWRGAEPFNGVRTYAIAKRAQIDLVALLAAHVPDVAFVAMHPGWADTAAVRDALPRFFWLTRPILRTPAQGADTIVWLAGAPRGALASDGIYLDRVRRPAQRVPGTRTTEAERAALWRLLVSQAGVTPA